MEAVENSQNEFPPLPQGLRSCLPRRVEKNQRRSIGVE
jgi:hypothetical protein